MLKSLFGWLDCHPESYWMGAGLVTAILAVRVWSALKPPAPADSAHSWRKGTVDALVLFLFVLGWRWPFLFEANELNPDESQLIAGALTLVHDPVFWRSVDGATSGPLNFYALLPLHWLGLPLDYFTARLSALLMVGGALFAAHRALARAVGRAPAWLGVLPAAGFFATVTFPDLVHYSSEHVALALVALAIGLLAARSPAESGRLRLACALAGLAPWAKLQAAPLSIALIAWAIWQECGAADRPRAVRSRRIGAVVLAAAAPSIAAGILFAVTGQLATAFRRYVVQNVLYVTTDRSLPDALREMSRLAAMDGRLAWLLGIGGTVVVATGGYYAICRRRPPALYAAAGAITVAAVIAVLAPRREFLHYCLLVPVPLAIWAGAGLGGWWATLPRPGAQRIIGSAIASALLLPFVVTRCFQPKPEVIGRLLHDWRHPRSGEALVIRELAPPGESLAIWGWANRLHVEAGLRQATLNSHSEWAISPNAQLNYQRAEFLDQVRHQQPAVFVDAVGPGAFAYRDRARQAHENYPELRDYIAFHYTLVADLGSMRIYGRNGLTTLPRLTAAHIDELLAQGRDPINVHIPRAPLTPLDRWPQRLIGGRGALMLLPPARLEWELDGDERQVQIEFGFDPAASGPGQSNGAEIIAELVDGTLTRPVFRRLLDPARVASDRDPQAAVAVLPPFAPGTRLSIRAAPGENGDNAWDWLYVANVGFRHHPHFLPVQFPQFGRVPDFAEARASALYQVEGRPQLSLHTPSTVGYLLHGGERRFRFDFGLAEGAYTNGGHTDGAVIRVQRERAGQPDVLLLDRFLQPQLNAGDRGVQHADIDLAGCARGDRLVLRITPGPSNNGAWDWTYVDRVELTGP